MNRTQTTLFRFALAATLALSAPVLPAQVLPEIGAPRETWAVLKMSDHPIGYLHTRTHATAADVREDQAMEIVLNRLGKPVRMASRLQSTESATGELIAFELSLQLSSRETVTHGRVEGDVLALESGSGSKTYRREIELDGVLLGPVGVRARCVRDLKSTGDRIEYVMFAPELGRVVAAQRVFVTREKLVVRDVTVDALVVEETYRGLPGPRRFWLDRDGLVLKQRESSPFGPIVATVSDHRTAIAALSGTELPAEMFTGTIARSNVRLARARDLDSVILRLTHREPKFGWPKLAAHNQRVTKQSAETVDIEITRPESPTVTATWPVTRTRENAEFLEPNAFISSDDPEVRRIATAIVGDEADAWAAAMRLEEWVCANMRFDVGVALAPASEIIHERRGTCTEYAILVAALTRSAGIPSRIAQGYVYMGGIWGGHAWAEVQIGQQWFPLDAAVWTTGIADPARFAFVHTSLKNGAGDLNVGGKVFGRIDVAVVAFERAGATTVVEAGAPAIMVEGDEYRDAGLGLSLKLPAGAKFTDLDACWPDKVVVGVAAADGTTVKVYLAGREPGRTDDEERTVRERSSRERGAAAVRVWLDGSDVWTLHAVGLRAQDLLDEVWAGLRLAR